MEDKHEKKKSLSEVEGKHDNDAVPVFSYIIPRLCTAGDKHTNTHMHTHAQTRTDTPSHTHTHTHSEEAVLIIDADSCRWACALLLVSGRVT